MPNTIRRLLFRLSGAMARIGIPVLVAVVSVLVMAGYADSAVVKTHAVAMHGQAKYPPTFTHFDYVNPDAPRGGTVRLPGFGSFDSLNAFIIKGQAVEGLGFLYDSLTTASADEAFTRYGLLAESMELPEDRSWIIFNLRPEVRWHDGQPVTADDVIFTFDIIRKQGAPQYQFYYADIDKIEKIGPLRVKFTFKSSANRELALVVGEQAILPRHYWQGRDFSKTTLEPPLGSGPYRIQSLEAGRYIVYERVADYWGRDLPVNRGRYNFDIMRYDYYRDETIQLEAFKAGEYDYQAEYSSKHWATAYDLREITQGLMIKEEIPHNRPQGMQGYVYNTRREMFKDARVREALAYAFDFERSNKTLFYDQYTRSRSYFDNSELAATGLPSDRELELLKPFKDQLPPRLFSEAYEPPKTDGSGRIRSNLAKAVKLLKAAGWRVKSGKLEKAGRPFVFEILLVQPGFERITLPFAKNLERLGVEARVRTVDAAQYIKRLETYDFDIIVSSWGQSLSPGNEQRNFWSSAAADQQGSYNFAGIKDPVVDALIEKLIAAPDRDSLVARCRALDRVLQWGFYVIPQWHIGYDRLAYWNKFSQPAITPEQGVQFSTWWVAPDKEQKLKGKIRSVNR